MGSLEALELYWTSPPVLAILTSFLVLGLAIAAGFSSARGRTRTRLRFLRAATWLSVAFWSFVALSLVLCFLLADPVEYAIGTAKAVAILSISLAIGLASTTAIAIRRGLPVIVRPASASRRAWTGEALDRLATRLAARFGLPPVRVRVEPGDPAAMAEPPDALVVSEGLLGLLSEKELEAVLLHELAHLANQDGVSKAFTGVLSRLLFFDPFLRLLHRASHREREHRADEETAKAMGGGLPLASALETLRGGASLSGEGESVTNHPPLEERISRLRT